MKRKPSATFCHCGDHAFAPLTKGYMALVSPEDAPVLLQNCWHAHVGRSQYVTVMSGGGKCILSRRVLGALPGELVDHKNRDTADCRRPNLRYADPVQNQGNRRPTIGRKLPKGVLKKGNRYAARITHRGERLYLGSYQTIEGAAHAYAEVAKALFGEFARVE